MFATASQQPTMLDIATLSVVAICLAALLGLFLLFAWLQQRSVRALAWWGAAYLIGASAIALWGSPSLAYRLPPEVPEALAFVACGMIWNGIRLFHGRKPLLLATFVGAAVWLVLYQLLKLSEAGNSRTVLGAVVVAGYTFVIAYELWRERRKSLHSRTAAIVVPCLHAAIFLMPLAMRTVLPDASANWLTIFALETIVYAVGAAFIVLVMVNDHYIHVYRTAATTDHLTGLMNRRAFLENAQTLCEHQGGLGEPVTLMMFDLDNFKSINDCYGHAIGDDVLRKFAQIVQKSMRASDIIGRLGGEEFAAIVPESKEVSIRIAERLRSAFEMVGARVGTHAIGATVSIGAAASYEPVTDIDALIIRADAALYSAKHDGRNRVCAAEDEPSSETARLNYAARTLQAAKQGRLRPRGSAARRPRSVSLPVSG